MKTELKIITPAIAREMLASNTDNRRLRQQVVDGLTAAWKRGEWKVTHQGIAFSRDGRLRDGQHRLAFISQLPEGSEVALNVTTGMENDTFAAIDQGARRTPADILGVSPQLSAVAGFLAKIHNSSNTTGLTVAYMAPFVEFVRDEFSELLTHCSDTCGTWSSAGVRAAAVLCMKRGADRDFVKVQYAALIKTHIEAMSPAARALLRQRINGVVASARRFDLFVRALRVFNPDTASMSRVQINDQAAEIQAVRDYLGQAVMPLAKTRAKEKSPDDAGQEVAKPKAILSVNGGRVQLDGAKARASV